MIGIEYFLFGYFLITPSEGKHADAYNLLLSHGIGAKRVRDGRIAVREKNRKSIIAQLIETGASISDPKGLPYFIYRNRKRYGVFSALVLSFLCFSFASSRVWDVRIQGADATMEQEMLSALRSEGLSVGVPFRNLDFSAIENGLRESCPSVAWVNVHRRGTVIHVNVLGAQLGESVEDGAIGNLIAAEDCVILEVSPDRGVPCVRPGDAVRAGDVLISAVHPDGTLSGASGRVMGRVSGEICASASVKETKKVSEKIKNVSFSLNFFDFSINIFKNYRNLPNGYDIIESERRPRLFGRVALPLSVTVCTAYTCREDPISYSEAEAIRLAGVRLQASLSAFLSKGEMESMRTAGEWKDGAYVLTVQYVQIRNVAKLEPIHLAGEK